MSSNGQACAPAVALTKSQSDALKWLRERGGDGCFDRHGVALAQGETAPVMRSTWNALRDNGLVEFYGGAADGGKGYGRLRLVPLRTCGSCAGWGIEDDAGMGERVCVGNAPGLRGTYVRADFGCAAWLGKAPRPAPERRW